MCCLCAVIVVIIIGSSLIIVVVSLGPHRVDDSKVIVGDRRLSNAWNVRTGIPQEVRGRSLLLTLNNDKW